MEVTCIAFFTLDDGSIDFEGGVFAGRVDGAVIFWCKVSKGSQCQKVPKDLRGHRAPRARRALRVLRVYKAFKEHRVH